MLPQLLLLFAECITVPEVRYGELEVLAVTAIGDHAKIDSMEVYEYGKRTMSLLRGKQPGKLKYGDYVIHVHSPGFRTASFDVRIAQAHTLFRAQLEVAEECGPRHYSLNGIIKRTKRRGDLWVKAIPLRGTGGFETKASLNGHFLLAGLPFSSYILLVLEDDKVVHQQTVAPNEPVTIQLN